MRACAICDYEAPADAAAAGLSFAVGDSLLLQQARSDAVKGMVSGWMKRNGIAYDGNAI